jgi:phage-related minor tail protein
MKTNEPGHRDDALRKLLKEWRTDASLPTRFQESVWQRIQRGDQADAPVALSVWSGIARWISRMLPRPALAASYVAVLLAVGVTAGWAQARQETARVNDELGLRYVRVLDPYLAPRK